MRRYLFYFPLLFLMVSCEIIEEDISGRAVTTIAPANDAEVPAGSVMFRWRAVDRATGYELCVATEGRIVADTLLAADTLGLARKPAGETVAFTGMPTERDAPHFPAGISTEEAVRRRRRYCTSSGELQSAAGGGGERPTAPSAVESSKQNSIGITDSSLLP